MNDDIISGVGTNTTIISNLFHSRAINICCMLTSAMHAAGFTVSNNPDTTHTLYTTIDCSSSVHQHLLPSLAHLLPVVSHSSSCSMQSGTLLCFWHKHTQHFSWMACIPLVIVWFAQQISPHIPCTKHCAGNGEGCSTCDRTLSRSLYLTHDPPCNRLYCCLLCQTIPSPLALLVQQLSAFSPSYGIWNIGKQFVWV